MLSSPQTLTLGLFVTVALSVAGCSTTATVGIDGSTGNAGGPGDDVDAVAQDVPPIPVSCGDTDDCARAGLDVDGGETYTCVFPSDVGGCAALGHCQVLTLSSSSPTCATQTEICPCSGGTQVVPPCWPTTLTPYPIQSLGPCPVDAGK